MCIILHILNIDMKNHFTIAFLFVFCAVSAQDKKTDSLDLNSLKFKPRYYIIQPCFCPEDGTIRINSKEYDPNNPYRYTDQKPIVLKPSDSLLEVELKNGWIVRKKDSVPVL